MARAEPRSDQRRRREESPGLAAGLVAGPEVVELELSAVFDSIGGEEPDLVGDEREGARRAHGDSPGEPARGVEPARNVDGENRYAALVHAPDDVREGRIDVAREADAEESVDDHRG